MAKKKMTIAKAFKVRSTIKKWLDQTSFSSETGIFINDYSEKRFEKEFPVKGCNYDLDAANVTALKEFYSGKRNPIYDNLTPAEWLQRHLNAFDDLETINKAIEEVNSPVRALLLSEAAVQKKIDFYDDITASHKRMKANYPEPVIETVNEVRRPSQEDTNGRVTYVDIEVKQKRFAIDIFDDINFSSKLNELEHQLIDIRDQITAIDNSTFIEVELKEDWA